MKIANTNFNHWDKIDNVFMNLAAFTWRADYAHQVTGTSGFEKQTTALPPSQYSLWIKLVMKVRTRSRQLWLHGRSQPEFYKIKIRLSFLIMYFFQKILS